MQIIFGWSDEQQSVLQNYLRTLPHVSVSTTTLQRHKNRWYETTTMTGGPISWKPSRFVFSNANNFWLERLATNCLAELSADAATCLCVYYHSSEAQKSVV